MIAIDEAFSDTLNSSEDEDKPQPLFESQPSKNHHQKFFNDCMEVILKEAVFEGTSRKSKVIDFHQPEELLKIFDVSLQSSPKSHKELIKLLKDVIKFSVKTGHPYFINQLFSSVDPYGLIGQFLTDALNPSAYTYEVAPLIILMEEEVLKEMRLIVGWTDGDGIFCPGGSMANGYAISCARHYKFPQTKTQGLYGLPKLILFTSEDAHYSVKKFASFLGLGTDNVHLIRTDSRGKMDWQHLEISIQNAKLEGSTPFMVSATAGTTVLGAFDPIDKIAIICNKYNLWLHVDAAWGGGALVSKKYRKLLRGIEKADSVTWNPHKLLTAPQQCSTFLVRHKQVLTDAHSENAAYLFQKDKFYDTKYDTGDKHVQCGRKADVLKFWFMWKAKGTVGLEKHIDKTFSNAELFYQTIKERDGFEMVLDEPECTNICFWYVPSSLRVDNFRDRLDSDKSYWMRLHETTAKMKERMMRDGTMMVTYQTHKKNPNFFRVVFQNSGISSNDVQHLVEEFERLGQDL